MNLYLFFLTKKCIMDWITVRDEAVRQVLEQDRAGKSGSNKKREDANFGKRADVRRHFRRYIKAFLADRALRSDWIIRSVYRNNLFYDQTIYGKHQPVCPERFGQ